MICGNRTFIPDIGQHRFCTLMIGLSTNPNHDMPNQENRIRPHRSGEWTWATPYPDIGPSLENFEFYSRDYDIPLDLPGVYFQNKCMWCDVAVPQYQVGNVLSTTPTDIDYVSGCSYRCTGCSMDWQTIESRKEHQT